MEGRPGGSEIMPLSFTGIDINDDYLTAVQVVRGFGGWELTTCARIQMKGDEGPGPALDALSESMNLKGGECIVALPGAATFYRNLAVPFKDKRKQREVLPFELEPLIPFLIDEVSVDFFSTHRSDTPELLAVFAEKRVIGELLDTLKEHGIDPEVLSVRGIPMALCLLNRTGTPNNGVLLDLGEKRVTLVLWENQQVVLIRTFVYGHDADGGWWMADGGDQASTVLQALLDTVRHTIYVFGADRNEFAAPEKVFLTGVGVTLPKTSQFVAETLGIAAENVDLCHGNRVRLGEHAAAMWHPSLMDGALSLVLAHSGKGVGLNLRRNEFEIQKRSFYRSKGFRKAVAWLLVIAALWAVDMGVDAHFLKQRMAALDDRILAVFKKSFPHVSRIVDPVKQAQIEVNEMKRAAAPGQVVGMSGKALDLLLEISERIPDAMDLHVSRLVIDPHSVRIKGDTDTYNTVDRVKQGFNTSPLFKTTTITSANLDRTRSRVLFEIKLGR